MDPAEKIKELAATLASVSAVLDMEAMRTEIAELREQSADPELWSDQANAQKVTRQLSTLESMVTATTSRKAGYAPVVCHRANRLQSAGETVTIRSSSRHILPSLLSSLKVTYSLQEIKR